MVWGVVLVVLFIIIGGMMIPAHDDKGLLLLLLLDASSSSRVDDYCTVQLEQHKLNRIQQHERRWLQSALGYELDMVKKMEDGVVYMETQNDNAADKMAKDALRMKILNDERREREEAKQAEIEAQARLDRAMAKEQFLREQEQLAIQRYQEEQHKQVVGVLTMTTTRTCSSSRNYMRDP